MRKHWRWSSDFLAQWLSASLRIGIGWMMNFTLPNAETTNWLFESLGDLDTAAKLASASCAANFIAASCAASCAAHASGTCRRVFVAICLAIPQSILYTTSLRYTKYWTLLNNIEHLLLETLLLFQVFNDRKSFDDWFVHVFFTFSLGLLFSSLLFENI